MINEFFTLAIETFDYKTTFMYYFCNNDNQM